MRNTNLHSNSLFIGNLPIGKALFLKLENALLFVKENEILELTLDLDELDIQRDFDVLSVPQNQIDFIRRQLNNCD